MNQEIKYSGFSAVPSDYECPDGSLAVSINLLPENGALQPVLPPSVEVQLSKETGSCVYIHKTSSFTHYLVAKDNAYSWFDKSKPTELTSLGVVNGFINVTSVGNTLVFLTESGMQYYLWKGEDEGYLYLGSKIPECPLSFGLQGELKMTDEFEIDFDAISFDKNNYNKLTTATDPFCTEFTDSNKTKITDAVLAKVNKFIAEESTSKGKFLYPFLVRYAYRLYDGSLIMHSSPVLMIASSDLAPEVAVFNVSNSKSDKSANHAKLRVIGVLHSLDYAAILQSRLDMLKNWKDIVRSVDIFITKPIYTYDQNEKCTRFVHSQDSDAFSVCKLTNQTASTTTYPLRYQKQEFHMMYAKNQNNFETIYSYRLMLPKRSVDVVKEDIKSASQFYLLTSIKVDNLTTVRTKIDVEEDYLQSLVTREVMTDDYDSHDTLIPRYCFAYNSRLNLSNLQKRLYDEYNAGAMICHTDGYVGIWGSSSGLTPTIFDGTENTCIYYFIKQDGRDIVVQGEVYPMSIYNYAPILFLYYPNVNAYKAVIIKGLHYHYEVQLEQHNFLNGAFYFGGWENPPQMGNYPNVSSVAERTIDIPNKIYTSEVNNPFYFPLLGINTVGTGEIKGICSAAKALSQGQFGQFPLYAFTTEGVWALEVSSTGTYSARQPITRDVCINPDGITQLDSAVLFPTDRGLMLISGSQTQCISEAINSEYPFDATQLPGFTKLHAMLGHEPATDKCLPTLPFTEFLKKCQMIYDYVHQRVIVYAPSVTYAYVYSLKTQQWGMIFSRIASHLNSYPDALAVDASNAVLNFSMPKAEAVKCLYTTRPLKLEAANVLKTIDCIIQRGFFRKGNVATALYGSRDLVNWHLVWSSKDHYLRGFRGSPYKYFRIAGVATLGVDENIFGASVQFTPRQNNQPR